MFTTRQFLLLLCAAVLTVGCAPTDGAQPADESSVVLSAVCEAAAADGPAEAGAAFGGAHDGLHSLARELQDTDRRDVAGDLLEAKQQVEEAFATAPVPDDLPDRLDRLVETTADALAATGATRPTCPERSKP